MRLINVYEILKHYLIVIPPKTPAHGPSEIDIICALVGYSNLMFQLVCALLIQKPFVET